MGVWGWHAATARGGGVRRARRAPWKRASALTMDAWLVGGGPCGSERTCMRSHGGWVVRLLKGLWDVPSTLVMSDDRMACGWAAT